jgi:hypothetical protein
MPRRMTNEELFQLYDSDLALRLHAPKSFSDTRKFLTRSKDYLSNYPPSPEIAKGFLSQYANKKLPFDCKTELVLPSASENGTPHLTTQVVS